MAGVLLVDVLEQLYVVGTDDLVDDVLDNGGRGGSDRCRRRAGESTSHASAGALDASDKRSRGVRRKRSFGLVLRDRLVAARGEFVIGVRRVVGRLLAGGDDALRDFERFVELG